MKGVCLVIFMMVGVFAAIDTVVVTDRSFFEVSIDSSLIAGDTVVIYDSRGRPTWTDAVHCTTDAVIEYISRPGAANSTRSKSKFVYGGWHKQRIHKIFPGGTTDSTHIKLKTIED